MQVGYEKVAIFYQYLALSRVVNAATVRCYQHGATRFDTMHERDRQQDRHRTTA